MTNQYMTKLYHDLLSNSPQTVTIDIPADMGTGQISQIVTKQGAVVSDWRMNYFSDMNVQGVSSEEYIQMLFCFNDGVSWNIADNRQSASIQKGESCIYRCLFIWKERAFPEWLAGCRNNLQKRSGMHMPLLST